MLEVGAKISTDRPCELVAEKRRGPPVDFEALKQLKDRLKGLAAGPFASIEIADVIARGPSVESFSKLIVTKITKTGSDAPDPPPSSLSVKSEYPVWFGTNRKPVLKSGELSGYSAERDDRLHYGLCRVFVPESHKIGSTGSSWWQRLKAWEDDRLKLLAVNAFTEDNYWSAIKREIEGLPEVERRAVVFIHGYKVSFEDAALRAAQIGFDLSIPSMAFFSWPSRGTLKGYAADEASIEASAFYMEQFLAEFAERSGAARLHVIAHSMGNRGLLSAINAIVKNSARHSGVKFGQFILAAADVDSDVFQQRCAAYAAMGSRTTLYVSKGDVAVGASQWLHGFPRIGLAPPLFVTKGIDTINVTNVDLTSLGHGYIAEARAVLTDMHQLIAYGSGPASRMGLRMKSDASGQPYWEFAA